MTPILVLGFNVIILIYRENDQKKKLKENDTNTLNVVQVSYLRMGLLIRYFT